MLRRAKGCAAHLPRWRLSNSSRRSSSMRKVLKLGTMSLLVMGAVAFASPVMAQFRGGPPGGGGGFGGGGFGGGGFGGSAAFLLQDENVKKELGLVPEQESKIRAISERSQSDM